MKKVAVVVGSCKVSGFPSEPAATYLLNSFSAAQNFQI